MRRIIYDARHLMSGIGRYITHTLSYLLTTDLAEQLTVITSANGRDTLIKEAGASEKKIICAHCGIYNPAAQIELLKLVPAGHIFISPHFTIPFFYRGKIITTIHDLIHLQAGFLKKNTACLFLQAAAKKSDFIITVSNHTRMEFISRFKPRCTVSTIYNGVSVPLQNSDFKKKFSFPFVFSSGNIKKHKNFISVIRAFAEFTKKGRHENVRLVIAGDTSDSSYTELINFSEKNLPGRVIFTGSIPDDEYFRLLRQAEVYLFLSRSEGFGYTPLEAMLCGTPVICSDAGALTESAGAGALCCSPFDTGQAAIFLQRLFSDRKFRLECITRGNRHARNFSVKKSGAAHYEIIKSLLRQDK